MSDFTEIAFCANEKCVIKDKPGYRHRHFENGLIQFIWTSPDVCFGSDKIKVTSFNVQFSEDEGKPSKIPDIY